MENNWDFKFRRSTPFRMSKKARLPEVKIKYGLHFVNVFGLVSGYWHPSKIPIKEMHFTYLSFIFAVPSLSDSSGVKKRIEFHTYWIPRGWSPHLWDFGTPHSIELLVPVCVTISSVTALVDPFLFTK